MTRDPITLAERYALEESIASGGMAKVWRARDDVLARPVAVKILHPHFAEDEAFIERFRREAFAAASLAHPHIVAIYDTGSERNPDDGVERHYIVMEFCGGGTVADLLKQTGPMEPADACSIVAMVCDALAYAHRHDIVHRDIKPQNVLLTDDGSLKVADFGIAKAAFAKSDITATGAILGTVTYLSPEQVQGKDPGPPSDIYSVGVLLYELLTGRPPFEADTPIATAMAHVRNPAPSPRSIRAGIPRAVEQIVMKALAKKPEDRYASASEMAGALRSVSLDPSSTGVLAATDLPSTGTPPSSTGPDEGRRGLPRELRWLVPVLLVIALAVVAVFVVPGLLEDEESGGPGPSGNSNSTQPIQVREVTDFDPLGDNSEHPEEVGNAVDNDPSTTWGTEDYSTPMHEQKDGVGLIIDLGDPTTVSEVVIQSPTPGYTLEVRYSDEESNDIETFEVAAEVTEVGEQERITFDEPPEGRYWLVLLTRLAGDGSGAGEISEVKFFGS